MSVSPVVTPSPGVGTHGYITIVDAQGYVIGTVATSDGAQFGSVSGESTFLYNSGGPPLASGMPSQFSFDRLRSYLGKGPGNGTISATSIGDANITFSVAPQSIMPGQAIRLSGGANIEYVYAAPSPTFTPSSSATVIPLQSPVVYAGQTTALWDAFSVNGAGGQYILPTGVSLGITALQIPGNATQIALASNADNDNNNPLFYQGTVPMNVESANIARRQRSPDAFKPFNAQAVTISSANTPTAIWTPATGKKFRLMGYWFSSTVACSILFHDLASVGGTGVMNVPSPVMAAAGIVQCPPIGNGILSAAANNKLWIDATAATTLTGFVWGTEE